MSRTTPIAPFCCTALALVALASAGSAQVISAEFTPNPVPPGAPVTTKATDSLGAGLNLSSPCGWYTIHSGKPDGPIVPLGIFCPQVIVPVAPHGSFSFSWDQKDSSGALVPPGDYWIELKAWDAGFSVLHRDLFCLSIQGPNDPALRNTTPAKVGTTLSLAIDAPQAPGAFYLVLGSFTSNNPLALPAGGLSCLDFDILLQLTFTPNPAFFPGFQGLLDGSGKSTSIGLNLPANPGLAWRALKLQGFLVTPAGIDPTNGISLTVAP